MGLRGPRGKPDYIKRLEGNPGRRRLRPPGVEASGAPFVPEYLGDDARACVELAHWAMPPGIYGAPDSYLLAAFGTAWAIHKRACEEIARPGFLLIDGGMKPSRWITIMNQQAALMVSLGDRLGLDPKSRAALNPPADRRRPSKFDGFTAQTPSPPN